MTEDISFDAAPPLADSAMEPDETIETAPGAPGIAPNVVEQREGRRRHSHHASRVWFTVGHGVLNEIYWPRVDAPQVRDLGFIVADGSGFWSEVKRDAVAEVRSSSRASRRSSRPTGIHATS